jgi:type II secretory pathway pseudopilin PulG
MKPRLGFTLIGLVVVLAIIVILAGVVYGLVGAGSKGAGGEEKSIPARAIEKAESVECQSNLNQLRQAVTMYTMAGDPPPKSLDELNLGSISKCPVSGEAYGYDPATGRVWCTKHPKY